MDKKNLGLWIGTGLLALLFVFAGVAKLVTRAQTEQMFSGLGLPGWLGTVISIIEIAGAILLFVPSVAAYAAGVLAVIMVGAIWASAIAMGPVMALFPAAVLVALIFLARARMK